MKSPASTREFCLVLYSVFWSQWLFPYCHLLCPSELAGPLLFVNSTNTVTTVPQVNMPCWNKWKQFSLQRSLLFASKTVIFPSSRRQPALMLICKPQLHMCNFILIWPNTSSFTYRICLKECRSCLSLTAHWFFFFIPYFKRRVVFWCTHFHCSSTHQSFVLKHSWVWSVLKKLGDIDFCPSLKINPHFQCQKFQSETQNLLWRHYFNPSLFILRTFTSLEICLIVHLLEPKFSNLL